MIMRKNKKLIEVEFDGDFVPPKCYSLEHCEGCCFQYVSFYRDEHGCNFPGVDIDSYKCCPLQAYFKEEIEKYGNDFEIEDGEETEELGTMIPPNFLSLLSFQNMLRKTNSDTNYLDGKRIAIYGRVSSKELEPSLLQKVERLKKYVKINNSELVDCYLDIGFNGDTLERPDLQRLIQDAKNEKLDIVLMGNLGEWARTGNVYLKIKSLINEIGFIFLDDELETITDKEHSLLEECSISASNFIEERLKNMNIEKVESKLSFENENKECND